MVATIEIEMIDAIDDKKGTPWRMTGAENGFGQTSLNDTLVLYFTVRYTSFLLLLRCNLCPYALSMSFVLQLQEV